MISGTITSTAFSSNPPSNLVTCSSISSTKIAPSTSSASDVVKGYPTDLKSSISVEEAEYCRDIENRLHSLELTEKSLVTANTVSFAMAPLPPTKLGIQTISSTETSPESIDKLTDLNPVMISPPPSPSLYRELMGPTNIISDEPVPVSADGLIQFVSSAAAMDLVSSAAAIGLMSSKDFGCISRETTPVVSASSILPAGTETVSGSRVPYTMPQGFSYQPVYHKYHSEDGSSKILDSVAPPYAVNPRRSTSVVRPRAATDAPLVERTQLDLLASLTAHDSLLMSKHLQTNHLMTLHNLKARLSKYQNYVERAFTLVNVGTEDAIVEGFGIVSKVMTKSWAVPRIGHDLAYGLCDYMRETGVLDKIIDCFIRADTTPTVRLAAGQALEECLSSQNREYLVKRKFLKPVIIMAESFSNEPCEDDELAGIERLRVSISLMESMFKHSPETSLELIDLSALDHMLNAIKNSKNPHVLRHCSLAMANLAMYSETDCHQKMTARKVQDWLFILAALQDDITRYYACLAICMLVSNKEIEAAVIKSGTLSLVEPFLTAHKPEDFAKSDYKHSQGRPEEWLHKLVPMLSASRCEARSLAAFHFAMEAGIKKEQGKLDVFQAINAIAILKQVASSPDGVGPKYARMALKIIGEEMPYKLSQQVALWSVEDVEYWVKHIGFEAFAKSFREQMVDGDILLLLTDKELEKDIGMNSGLLRKRFMRELDSLKISADYSCVDESHLDQFLMSLNQSFSVYTYALLELGVETSSLHTLTEEVLTEQCNVFNPVHRKKLIQAFQDISHIDDMEIAILSRHIDIFISYRRSNGSQLASLIKVLLQLRGHKVFIDVDRLYAGQFDASLLKNIQAAKHFVLVLTPNALDRTLEDTEREDWVHKEILCAMEHNRNIIPIFDPAFEWPDEMKIPGDIRAITKFNGVRWIHEYQEACVDKVEKFIKGEVNKSSSGVYGGNTSPAVATSATYGKTNGPSIWKSRSKQAL